MKLKCLQTSASESPIPSSDRESPMSDSSGTSSMSNESGCFSSKTSSSLPPHGCTQQTVTTKVLATAKLKVEVHAPFLDREYSASSSSLNSSSRSSSRNREQIRKQK